jgi:hypothetical protein
MYKRIVKNPFKERFIYNNRLIFIKSLQRSLLFYFPLAKMAAPLHRKSTDDEKGKNKQAGHFFGTDSADISGGVLSVCRLDWLPLGRFDSFAGDFGISYAAESGSRARCRHFKCTDLGFFLYSTSFYLYDWQQ